MKNNNLKYSKRVRMYKTNYVSVCIYLNVNMDDKKFYDTVIYRKIKNGNGYSYKRGANLKPVDIEPLYKILEEVDLFLKSVMQK